MKNAARKLDRLAEEHPGHVMVKFFRGAEDWLRRAMKIARSLGLERSRPLKILDLGCGVGYFVAACREMGHGADGLDRADPVLQEAAAAIGVRYVPHMIGLARRLPEELAGYDMLTMMGVNLRHTAGGDFWGWPEYARLAADLWPRIVPGGRWVHRPNLQPQTEIVLDPNGWREILGESVSCEVSSGQIVLWKESGEPKAESGPVPNP